MPANGGGRQHLCPQLKRYSKFWKDFFFEISFILDFLYKNRIGILDNSESNEMHIKK